MCHSQTVVLFRSKHTPVVLNNNFLKISRNSPSWHFDSEQVQGRSSTCQQFQMTLFWTRLSRLNTGLSNTKQNSLHMFVNILYANSSKLVTEPHFATSVNRFI